MKTNKSWTLRILTGSAFLLSAVIGIALLYSRNRAVDRHFTASAVQAPLPIDPPILNTRPPKNLSILDSQSGQVIRTINDTDCGLAILRFSPDDKRIAEAGLIQTQTSADGGLGKFSLILRVWDVTSGQISTNKVIDQITTPNSVGFPPRDFLWSPTNQIALTVGRFIYILDANSFETLGIIQAWPENDPVNNYGSIEEMEFSPDKQTLFTADSRGDLVAWDLKRMQQRASAPPGKFYNVNSIRADANGAWVIAVDLNGAKVFSQDLSSIAASFGEKGSPWPSPDLIWNGSVNSDPAYADFKSWNDRTKGALAEALIGDFSSSPNVNGHLKQEGPFILDTAASAPTLLDARTGGIHSYLSNLGYADYVLSPQGHYLAMRWIGSFPGPDAPPHGWVEVKRNDATPLRWHAHDGFVLSAVVDPKGAFLITAGEDRKIKIWDLSNGHLLRTLTGHYLYNIQLTLSSDGKYLASHADRGRWSEKQGTLVWEVSTGRLLGKFGHGELTAAFHPSKPWILTGRTLWNIETGTKIGEVPSQDGGGIFSFSPDWKVVAVPDQGGVSILDGTSFEKIQSLSYEESKDWPNINLAFSPDGKWLWFFNDEGDNYDGPLGQGHGYVWNLKEGLPQVWQINADGHRETPPNLERNFPPEWKTKPSIGSFVSRDGKTTVTFDFPPDEC